MPHLCDVSQCSSCGVCAAVCPTKALTMQQDNKGFYRPAISNQCIECGLCEKTCPVLHPVKQTDSIFPKSFVLKSTDSTILQKSASGGAFGCLAHWALAQNGCVYGASWGKDRHLYITRAETPESIDPMRGSKYVYSHADKAYPDAKAALQQGRVVLFTGLPCQIAALYAYLGHSYPNLYTAELLCHGAGSEKVFDQCCMALEIQNGKPLRSVDHTSKEQPWNSLIRRYVTYHWQDGTSSGSDHLYDPYLILYLKAYCYNEACFSCPFATLPRHADFTIGDLRFYNAEGTHSIPATGGVSAVFCNTKKALQLQSELQKNSDALWEEMPLDEALLHCQNYWNCTPKPADYQDFWKALTTTSPSDFVKNRFLKRPYYQVIAWAKRMLLNIVGPENIAKIQFYESRGRKANRVRVATFLTQLHSKLNR